MSNRINTSSGIVFCVSDRPVCRLRGNWFLLKLHTGLRSSFSTCAPGWEGTYQPAHRAEKELINLHTGLRRNWWTWTPDWGGTSQPAHRTEKFLLNLHTIQRRNFATCTPGWEGTSQPAHRAEKELLNLHTGLRRNFSTCTPDSHLQRALYQMLYEYNLTSWWWAQCGSKHVEDYNNKRII